MLLFDITTTSGVRLQLFIGLVPSHVANNRDNSYVNTLNLVWGEERSVQRFGGET